MKKLIALVCVLTLCLVGFAACNNSGDDQPDVTGTADSTAKATATAASTTGAAATTAAASTPSPTKEATEEPTPTPTESGPKVDYGVYTIDVDITIIDGNAGIVFAGADEQNFLMWQLSVTERNDGYLYLRPHEWVGNTPACLDEVRIDSAVATDEYNKVIHMQIKVDNGTVTTFINGTEVDVRDDMWTDEFYYIGLRADAYANSTIMEVGAFDNLKVTNSLGEVVLEEDFEGETNFFTDYIQEKDAVVENGRIVVGGDHKTLIMAEMVDLKKAA